MKMKSMVLITFSVVASSFASAQTFGFASADGDFFCTYEQLSKYSGHVWQGTDNLSACGVPVNATIVGINTTLSAAGNPAGFAIKGVAYADNTYDAFSESYTGAQWLVVTSLPKCPLKHPYNYAWIGFASVSGLIFGDNYGLLTCSIPGRDGAQATRGFSIGNSKIPVRK